MHCYRIDVTKDLGGECVDYPSLTLDDLLSATDRFEEIVLDEFNELNHEMMRNIGGRSEIFLSETENVLLQGDVIKHVTVKRPLHSPNAMVYRRDYSNSNNNKQDTK